MLGDPYTERTPVLSRFSLYPNRTRRVCKTVHIIKQNFLDPRFTSNPSHPSHNVVSFRNHRFSTLRISLFVCSAKLSVRIVCGNIRARCGRKPL